MKTLRLAVPLIAGLAILAAQASLGARAEDYPTRPITIVVPFPAGGNADALARILARQLSERLGVLGGEEEVTRIRRQPERRVAEPEEALVHPRPPRIQQFL